jgi:hypothetical protein
MGNGNNIWKIALALVVAYFAIKVILWAIGALTSLLYMAIVIAVVVGVIWLLMQLFGKKKAF